jgi:hypothetical protein
LTKNATELSRLDIDALLQGLQLGLKPTYLRAQLRQLAQRGLFAEELSMRDRGQPGYELTGPDIGERAGTSREHRAVAHRSVVIDSALSCIVPTGVATALILKWFGAL